MWLIKLTVRSKACSALYRFIESRDMAVFLCPLIVCIAVVFKRTCVSVNTRVLRALSVVQNVKLSRD
jgi:uncharacterized protein (DUF983 family)